MAKKSDGRTILNATAVKDQMIASLFFHKESCKKTTKFLYDLDGCRGQSNEKPLIGCEEMRMNENHLLECEGQKRCTNTFVLNGFDSHNLKAL